MNEFDDVLERLEALQETTESFARDAQTAFRRLVPSMEDTILESFIQGFEEAMDETGEYAEGKLREHLIKNLYSIADGGPVHVRVYTNGTVEIFDEEFAGTAADFEAADYGSTDPRRFAFWKYGIYKPAREGYNSKMRPKSGSLPDYDDIIEERLSKWGNKAPYWWFIEYGNQASGGEYPSFPGTNYIGSFRMSAQRAMSEFYRSFIDDYEDRAIQTINHAIETGRRQDIEPDEIRWNRIVTKTGNIIWRPRKGNRFVKGVIYEPSG